ncbi:MAG TPA: glycosyltransferase [Candidatus Babeliales bacterium]|nr:glycosyltransferase [Candidatus Babeliales bacterium]
MVSRIIGFYLTCVVAASSNFLFSASPYRVSIITSVYKGDDYIEEFMQDITRQTIFDQCELIMINANSPHNEEPVIKRYMEQYPNIVYLRLEEDPGLYAVWNIGIKMASADYVTNANLDDRLNPCCYEKHAQALDEDSTVDLAYSGVYITTKPHETFENNSANGFTIWQSTRDFNKDLLIRKFVPYPCNNPMWRKSLHHYYGLFDERFRSAGDLEMWLRAVIFGDVKFKRVDGIHGLYYWNPNGLSSSEFPGASATGTREKEILRKTYHELYDTVFQQIEFLDR